jgi:ParB family chromosome partitioning protein
MTKKKKSRLGKGLGALLSDVRQTTSVGPEDSGSSTVATAVDTAAAGSESNKDSSGLRELPIEWLQRGQYQPRTNMGKEALEELADSIRAQGIIQPLLVRRLTQEKYEIVAGERRWRGAQLAGLATVPAVVREVSDQAAMAVALIENIQRQDLNPIEEAVGFQRLIEEFGLTHEQIASTVGRSRTAVTNALRLLTLDNKVRELVEAGDLSMGHARALLALPDARQYEAARKVVARELSVRATEHLVKRLNRVRKPAQAVTDSSQDIKYLENELSDRIGARVAIQHSGKKGKLVIHYNSLDELDGILSRIK